MTSLVTYDSIQRPPAILSGLMAGYVALLPFQFEVGKGLNFAPADVLLLLVLLLAAGQLKYQQAGLDDMAFRHRRDVRHGIACGGGALRRARPV